MPPTSKRVARVFPVVVVLVVGAATVARGGESDKYKAFLEEKSSVLVTVTFVLRIGGAGGHEREDEITGVMIDPKGLVLCSNTQLGGFAARWSRFRGSSGSATVTPTDLKVLVGDDVEGIEAEFIARDTELDLAWVRIKEPGDREYDSVDFSKGIKPKVGQRIVSVVRMGKYFARTPVVSEGRIGGVTTQPRSLYVPTGHLGGGLGLPVYTLDGEVLGITVIQMPDPEELEADPTGASGMIGRLILPAAEVAKATRRALQSPDTE